jgi:hypothetical protein
MKTSVPSFNTGEITFIITFIKYVKIMIILTFHRYLFQRVVFQSEVFHPMINPSTGEMDVRSGFEEWRKNVNHIWQVVHYVRRAFYKVETKLPLNQEASEL